MVCEKQELLAEDYYQDDYENHQEEQTADHAPHPAVEQKKKHGIICRILTALHLKKRHKHHEHQKLISESHENISGDHMTKEKKSKEKKVKRRKSSSKNEPVTLPKRSLTRNGNNNNNNSNFAVTYEILEEGEFIPAGPIDTEFWDVDIEVREEETDVPDILSHPHIYSDDHFGQCYMDGPHDKYALLSDKPKTESQNASEFLKTQWQAKGAKKARKRIRTVMKATWQSLQTGVSSQTSILTPHRAVSSVIVTR